MTTIEHDKLRIKFEYRCRASFIHAVLQIIRGPHWESVVRLKYIARYPYTWILCILTLYSKEDFYIKKCTALLSKMMHGKSLSNWIIAIQTPYNFPERLMRHVTGKKSITPRFCTDSRSSLPANKFSIQDWLNEAGEVINVGQARLAFIHRVLPMGKPNTVF